MVITTGKEQSETDKRYSSNRKLVILTGKEHDTPLFRDLEPENVFLRPENCALLEKLPKIV